MVCVFSVKKQVRDDEVSKYWYFPGCFYQPAIVFPGTMMEDHGRAYLYRLSNNGFVVKTHG
jgi:hypothetical protein